MYSGAGGGVSQGRGGAHLGGEGAGRRPALPSGPGRGAAGTRHSLPGDRGGPGRGGRAPGWAGPMPQGRARRGHPPGRTP